MKRAICAAVVVCFLVSACGRPLDVSTPSGAKTYPTYGLLNEQSSRSTHVCYEVSIGNVVWSILLFETVIAPVYFIGYSLFNPVRLKRDERDTCNSIDQA